MLYDEVDRVRCCGLLGDLVKHSPDAADLTSTVPHSYNRRYLCAEQSVDGGACDNAGTQYLSTPVVLPVKRKRHIDLILPRWGSQYYMACAGHR